jgi:hypothetical protein
MTRFGLCYIIVFWYPRFPTGTRPRRLPQMGLSRLAVRNFDQPNGRPRLRRRHLPHFRLELQRLAPTSITSAALRFLDFRIRRMARILGHEFIGEYYLQLDVDLSMGLGHGHALRLCETHREGPSSSE